MDELISGWQELNLRITTAKGSFVMKKLVLILVVLSVVFGSCASPVDEVEDVNPFIGKWTHIDLHIIEFDKTNFIITYPVNAFLSTINYHYGTYTYTDTTITFDNVIYDPPIGPPRNLTTFTMDYEIVVNSSGTFLTIDRGNHEGGGFILKGTVKKDE